MKKLPEQARFLCDFLEHTGMQWRAFVTLTYPRPIARSRLMSDLHVWRKGIQAAHRKTIGYVCGVEAKPQFHAHLALLAAGALDCALLERLWLQAIGARDPQFARVEPYQPGHHGIAYIAKFIGTDVDEVSLSRKITD